MVSLTSRPLKLTSSSRSEETWYHHRPIYILNVVEECRDARERVGEKRAKKELTSPASPSSGQGSSGSKIEFRPHPPRIAHTPGP